MSRVQIRVTLDPETHELLTSVAARLAKHPATLAAELIAEGMDRLGEGRALGRPSLQLKKWLEPYLDDLRRVGGWPPDITLHVFDRIRDDARELYDAAAEEVGAKTLNREIGRLVKERLNAQVVTRDRKPQIIKAAKSRHSLIKAATRLEPASGVPNDQP